MASALQLLGLALVVVGVLFLVGWEWSLVAGGFGVWLVGVVVEVDRRGPPQSESG